MSQNLFYSSTAAQTSLTGAIGSGDTTCVLESTSGLPVSFPFKLLLDWGSGSQEVVYCTNLSGTTATLERGKDGTTAQAHSVGAVVIHGVSAEEFNNAAIHEAAVSGVHGVTGDFVGTTDTQTLTNKTIDGGDNTITNVPKASVDGTPSGNIVGDTDTQTLTNKTLTEPVINGTGGTLTLPAGPDTLVGLATVDTLTNKTINGAVIDATTTLDGTTVTNMPRGVVASRTSTLTTSGITTTETVFADIADVPVTTEAGRTYLLKVRIPVSDGTANDMALVRVRDGGSSAPTTSSTILYGEFVLFPTNTSDSFFSTGWIEWKPGAGSHNLGVFVQRVSGTGTVTVGSNAAGFEASLIVEDIGTS